MWGLVVPCSPSAKLTMFPITYGDQQKPTIGFERSAKPLCAGSIPARASNSFNNLGRPIPESALSGCQYGCQLALPPSSVRRLDSHHVQLSTQRLCRHVRRFVQNMGVELEKNVGARVPKALLRCLDGHPSFRHLCRSPVPQKTPRDVRTANEISAFKSQPNNIKTQPVVATVLRQLPHFRQIRV